MFEFYTDKFIDFTVSNDKTVNEAVVEFQDNLQTNFSLDTFLLNDIVKLLEKTILNKLSSDLLFQKNYWTWGFVTVYYSNFYLAQILNRLSDKFYIYARKDINKEILFDKKAQLHLFGQNNNDNTHQREFKLLKENYSKIKTYGDRKLQVIFDILKLNDKEKIFKYTIDNQIKESEIRNLINYQLKHYKEIHIEDKTIKLYNKWYINILMNKNYSSHYPNYFQLLMINEKRFLFLSILLQEVKNKNSGFEIKIDKLYSSIEKRYSTIFHDVNPETKKLIGDLLK